jgi:hypothetical protein
MEATLQLAGGEKLFFFFSVVQHRKAFHG